MYTFKKENSTKYFSLIYFRINGVCFLNVVLRVLKTFFLLSMFFYLELFHKYFDLFFIFYVLCLQNIFGMNEQVKKEMISATKCHRVFYDIS